MGSGTFARLAGSRRSGDGNIARLSATPATSRQDHAVLRRGLWALHDHFRHFTQLDLVVDLAGAGRGFRHGQRRRPRNSGSDRDSRRGPRSRECRRHDLYRRVQRTGRI